MRLKLVLTSLAAACMLASCSITRQAAVGDVIEFNYRTDNPSATGVVQVFDMGGSTIVQMRDLEFRHPTFINDRGVEIKHRVVGQTAVLEGIQGSFVVMGNGARTLVYRTNAKNAAPARVEQQPAPSTVVVEAKPPAVPTVSTLDVQIQSEITRLKLELAAVKAQLAAAAGPSPATNDRVMDNAGSKAPPPKAPQYAQIASAKQATAIVLKFKDNSDDLEVKPNLAQTLAELAKGATEISVTGYTDTARPSANSTRLAKGRAVAAVKYLLALGIDKSKIKVAFQPAGGFVADNTTADGRGQNRRVEIEII